MSNISSPTRFSNLEDRLYDPLNMNEKMRVPRTIKVVDHDISDATHKPKPWEGDVFDMKVPDRILVLGQDQYYGTSAPPREVLLENAIMPPDPEMVSCVYIKYTSLLN